MDNVADLILNGDGTLEQFGWFEHGCRFGFSVSNAGDLNKDGFADAIVGEDWHNSESGRVYVFYGGSEMDNVADLVLEGEGPSDNFGFSVSNAGDVNGDGANEFVVGACGYNNRNGKAYLYNCVTTLILSMNVNPEGGGTTVPTVGDHTYTSGQIVDISATPEAGYAFVNWTGDVVDPNALSTQVTMNADQTVAANFELPEGAVSYLTETVDNLNLPEGLENSLISKLKSIDFGTTNPLEVSVNSIASGSNSQTSGKDNATAVVNKLNAFINEVEAQSGKKILKEDADYLILFARRIIAAVQNPLGKKSEQDLVSVKEGMPTRYVLYPNHPNPFNPETKITYEIPEASDVLLSIYTINGVKIKDLDIGQRSSGRYTITWQAGGFPSGVYIIRLQAGRFFQMRKCMLIK